VTPREQRTDRGAAWVWVQSILLAALLAAGPLGAGSWHSPALVAAGGLLFLLAGALGVAGVVQLGRNRTPFPRPRAGSALVRHGVYRWVRHPLYLSVMGASLGWSLMFQSAAALAVAAGVAGFLDAKARSEERWLVAAFPDYTDYAARVRRFIPGIY